MPLYDFECKCGFFCEELVASNQEIGCPKCGRKMSKVWNKSAPLLETIVPVYPGSKKRKAGYTHTNHADHPATKIQSGYGGCVAPK